VAGLDADGFAIKTFEEIREEIREDIDTAFGASNMSRLETSVVGVLISIVALLAAICWQLAQSVYNSQSPSTASGALLDRVLALTGVRRLAQSYSEVEIICGGTNATALTAGRRVKNTVTNTYWSSADAATIVTLDAWVISTAYVIGDLVTNSGNVYYCTAAGTSAGSGGPTTTSTAITDGTATWRYCGAGTAAVSVTFAAEEVGPVVGAAGNVSSIETPQGGWTFAVNPLDADQGRSLETDAAARIRRNQLLASTGNAALDAIIGDVRAVDGVEAVYCFVNDTDATDGDGVPPHAVEVLVDGGDDADIFAALLATVAAGIETHGTESDDIEDSQGELQTVKFSRPTAVPIYCAIGVVIDSDDFPSDGDAQIKQALVDFTLGLPVGGYQFAYGFQGIGDDVIRNPLFSAVMQISGVTKVSSFTIGTAPAPVGTSDLSITGREFAEFDTSRIAVTHV
jgi:uncharacterized phage protein gp47/JayE